MYATQHTGSKAGCAIPQVAIPTMYNIILADYQMWNVENTMQKHPNAAAIAT